MSNRKSFSAKGRTPKKNPLDGISFDIDGEPFACHGHMVLPRNIRHGPADL